VSRLLLAGQAQGLLDEVVAFYAANGATLPDVQAVVPGSPGNVAWDCEQVTVALAGITTGSGQGALPLPQHGAPAGVALPRMATWSIQVVRCSPTPDEEGQPPGATELAAAGALALADGGLLSQCLVELAALQPGARLWLPIGGVINAGAVTSLGPDGGFQAMEATVTLSALEVG
jgi:hypothetical protein